MKKNIKAKWLDALQSGKYIHRKGELGEASFSEDRTNKCCALGVLMKINGYDVLDYDNRWDDQELPSEEILEEWGMNEEDANSVAKWNDRNKNYNRVIRFIEESL
jgi:hypothetical protein